MNFELRLDYPFYFILFCLLTGALYAFLTYYKSKYTDKNGRFFSFPNMIMALFRFISVSIIAFLLLSPFVKSFYKRMEKPAIVVAVDNSQSIKLNKDSTFYKEKWESKVNEFLSGFGSNYEIHPYVFGDHINKGINLNYIGSKTNISQVLEEIYDQYFNRNLGAIILASDGIYNEGRDPISVSRKFQAPVYSVALGDTIPPKDLLIEQIRYNEIVYSGDKFPVKVTFKAEDLKGEVTRLRITHKDKIKYSEKIRIKKSFFRKDVLGYLEAGEPGLKRFVVELDEIEGEMSNVNNRKNVFIDVLESRKKILILQESPHPDISVLHRSIQKNQKYEVKNFLIDEFLTKAGPGDRKLSSYHLVIFHNLPSSSGKGNSIVKKVLDQNISAWFIVGSQSDLNRFNNLGLGVKIHRRGKSFNEVLPVLQEDFTLFSLNDRLKEISPELPPLITPFGKFKFSKSPYVALKQKIGNVVSDFPMLFFFQEGKQKTGVLTGEGLWRWNLFEYGQYQDHKAIEGMISKTVQYLSVKADKRKFRLREKNNVFYEDEVVFFEAEVYDQTYQPVEDAKINMKVKDEQGKVYKYDFQPDENGYRVNIGYLPVGSYHFQAKTNVSGEMHSLEGDFVVKPLDVEFVRTVADHQLLYSLAKETGGKMFYPEEMKNITENLKEREDISTISYLEYRFKELINNKLMFFVILLFITVEWFFRKFYGGY